MYMYVYMYTYIYIYIYIVYNVYIEPRYAPASARAASITAEVGSVRVADSSTRL